MSAFEQQIEAVVDSILEDYKQERDIDRIQQSRQPDKDIQAQILVVLEKRACRILSARSFSIAKQSLT